MEKEKESKNNLDFGDLMLVSLGFVLIFGLFGFFAIGEYDIYIKNQNELETECFEFYKENSYVLNECSKFEDKLKEME